MRPLLVIAYAQHGRTSSGDYDPGAWADVDGDGLREKWEQEAPTAAAYLSTLAGKAQVYGESYDLPVSGRFVGWGDAIDPMRYDDGHKAIVDIHAREWLQEHPDGLSVVVCGHVNAGGGSYGVVAHDIRSTLGQAAAWHVSQSWDASPVLGQTVDRVLRWKGDPTGRDHERRISYCIRGAWDGPDQHCAILLEPGFLDNPKHARLWASSGLEDIAGATLAGLLTWAEA